MTLISTLAGISTPAAITMPLTLPMRAQGFSDDSRLQREVITGLRAIHDAYDNVSDPGRILHRTPFIGPVPLVIDGGEVVQAWQFPFDHIPLVYDGPYHAAMMFIADPADGANDPSTGVIGGRYYTGLKFPDLKQAEAFAQKHLVGEPGVTLAVLNDSWRSANPGLLLVSLRTFIGLVGDRG